MRDSKMPSRPYCHSTTVLSDTTLLFRPLGDALYMHRALRTCRAYSLLLETYLRALLIRTYDIRTRTVLRPHINSSVLIAISTHAARDLVCRNLSPNSLFTMFRTRALA